MHETVNISSSSKAEKRRWHRLVSGLTVGENFHGRIRFMTLTTAKGVTKDINKSFRALKLRIFRKFGWKFTRYFSIKTAEGNGVLHILYRGKFIPQKWLKQAWIEIHKSSIVDIREIHYRAGSRRIANYLIVNYLQKQKTLRMSYGWKWVWLGFCKSWENVKAVYKQLRTSGVPTEQGKSRSFKLMYRNWSVTAWKWRLSDPLTVSRQLKLTAKCFGLF